MRTECIDHKFHLAFDDMAALSSELQISLCDIYCGYLRQPISHERIIDNNFIIRGTCALNNEGCAYAVSVNCRHDPEICNIYKEIFKR